MSKFCINLLLFSLLITLQSNSSVSEANSDERSYVNKNYGLSLSSPEGWVFMSPEEVRTKTAGAVQPTPSTIVFVVRKSNPDDNVNIQRIGDIRRNAPTNSAARRFLAELKSQYPSMITQQVPGAHVLASRIIDMAGGIALEVEMVSMRGSTKMEQRTIVIIVRGVGYTITCTAREVDFSSTDRDGFRPILNSLRFE